MQKPKLGKIKLLSAISPLNQFPCFLFCNLPQIHNSLNPVFQRAVDKNLDALCLILQNNIRTPSHKNTGTFVFSHLPDGNGLKGKQFLRSNYKVSCNIRCNMSGRHHSQEAPEVSDLPLFFHEVFRHIAKLGYLCYDLAVEQLDPSIKKVGVFVNEPLRSLISISEEAGLDIIQLHGDEGEEYIKEVKHETGKELWKAVRVRMVKDIQEAQRLPADKLLLDSFSEESYGCTGKVMDFAVLDQADIRKPYFIAGGLKVENLPEILKKAEPYGIDISSGFETEGVKDRVMMLKVIQCVRGGKDE